MGLIEKPDREGAEEEPSRRQNAEERQEQIAAYFDGEMTLEETAAFESRMQKDEMLRGEVERWRDALEAARDWIAAEAPGVEHVAQLEVPSLAGRARAGARHVRARSVRSFVWRSLAAAAVFAAGVLVGQMTRQGVTAPNRSGAGLIAPSPQVKPEKTPAVPGNQQTPEKERKEIAGLSARYTDERGRLVVETTLKGSGARALWVVDGEFQLAQSTQIGKGEKP